MRMTSRRFSRDRACAPSRRTLRGMVESIPGVDKASLRIAAEPTAPLADFDPRRASLASLEPCPRRTLATKGRSVPILRVMDKPAELKPAARR